ncbi:MAG: hypothetical protein AAGA23_05900 [Pseudomonadota bacterium]
MFLKSPKLTRNVNRLDAFAEPDFLIQCQDSRPVDGDLACSTTELNLTDDGCVGFFPFASAGLRRVSGDASCGNATGTFLMFKR